MKSTVSIAATAIAVIFLHEKLSRSRKIGVAAIAMGAMALVASG